MKNFYRPLLLALCCAAAIQMKAQTADTLFVYFANGGMHAFPSAIVEEQYESDDSLRFRLEGGKVVSYALDDISRIGDAPDSHPRFSTFKFNNKYNEQLPTDAYGVIDDAGNVTATVGAIGKRLTASFTTQPQGAEVFADSVKQFSKRSRIRFAEPVTYTLTHPGYRVMNYVKVSDEVWSKPVENVTEAPIELTASMLSTNAPSNHPESEGIDKIIDGDTTTFFHSTWGTGEYEKLPLEVAPYVEIDLGRELQQFRFSYLTRHDTGGRMPGAFLLQTSTDGKTWTDLRELTAEDGLPQSGLSARFTSPTLKADAPFRRLRLVMTSANYKNYLCLAELSVTEVTSYTVQEPELIRPAEYAYRLLPYGARSTVSVNWLTDAATSVPRIDINTDGGVPVTSKETYVNATITIDGAGVFSDFTGRVQVKGRGNVTWTYEKKPYRLKFSSAQKPFGLTKGKSWVLLANHQNGSMLTNAIAMKVARMVQTPGANQIIPVELYMNGEYLGSYNFTQHVGLSNNSIDVPESSGALYELDSYYDEAFKFRDDSYNLPVNIKDPDLTTDNDGSVFSSIKTHFNRFTTAVNDQSEEITQLMNPDFFARFLLVNDVVLNTELGHPKSTYLYRENIFDDNSPYIWGPVWDFDWGFGYESGYTYYSADPDKPLLPEIHRFFRDIYSGSEDIRRIYYKEWRDFMKQHRDELIEYIDDYYDFARTSLEHNAERWPSRAVDYATNAANAKIWLSQRTTTLFDNLTPYELPETDTFIEGDANMDNRLSLSDAIIVGNYINGFYTPDFDFDRADVNVSNSITNLDLAAIDTLLWNKPIDVTGHMTLPEAEAQIIVEDFEMVENSITRYPLTVRTDVNAYYGMQFDIVLPEGINVVNILKPGTLGAFSMRYMQQADRRTYRVILTPTAGKAMPKGDLRFILMLKPESMVPETDRVLTASMGVMADNEGGEYRIAAVSATFGLTPTGIDTPTTRSISVRGGNVLTIESLHAGPMDIYGVDGRLVRNVNLKQGVNQFKLDAGIYIVAGQKAVVR